MPFEQKCRRFLDALYEGKKNSEFGVVKADHDAPLMDGRMAYTNYQLLNTLGLTREGIGKLLEPSFRYLQDMLDRSPVLRYQINMTTDHATIAEKELPDLAKYRRDTVLDMSCRTPLLEQTEFYKSFRSDTVRYFKERLRKGRIAVSGNYQELFGNAYEFLWALTDESYEPNATDKASDSEATNQPTEPKLEPYKPIGGKIRKPGTGCVTMINDHLYEGRFSPRVNGKRIAKNIYATTREECEEKLAELIKTMKAEIAEMKKTAKNA